ncbi:KN motif and ankyrin repeat domain-containing protein 4 [Oryzias melastigma]|uniref:KN motif and ankyrin repeat domain-containing protein 4-like n=1 Tax=Oryzias melastigma TaxID=30732 RepID=A0A3B3DCQ3_ORYME|nr:KN motif and ankyrin repeat domain-containing protein 4 [Oryzias melastigma]XP_024128966.1 KN motif and ankyrin repeat domain-containing protein 4 [Oryzias melastigma]
MAENGVKGKPPYSVETPYGFQIDLDFLKYVEDIEKGNTIKRVPIQRRNKGPRASTLPRNLNPSGCGYRPSPWGSTGALGPRSPPSDTHHHGYSLWTHSHRAPLFPTEPRSLAELEARIKEFDEQPLGEHIRPHLLRASSLPLTVLLRQESESMDDRSSIRSSRDYLNSPDSPQPQDCSGLLRRLSEALERVGELEMEVRVIPELRAQICILQEERERLRLGLVPHLISSTENGTTKPFALTHRSIADMKRPIKVRNSTSHDSSHRMHEWKTSTDLDELLTVTSLQAKVAALEQKLHETSLELRKVTGLLREQQAESGTKDEKIENLIKNPGMWVCAERVMVDQDGEETVVRSIEPDYGKECSFVCKRTAPTSAQRHPQQKRSSRAGVEPADGAADSMRTAAVINHIQRIKTLLDQQWECVCREAKPGDERPALKHPDPKVNSLQEQMMELVDVLLSHYPQKGQSDASKSNLKMYGSAQNSVTLGSEVPNERLTTKGNLSDSNRENQSLHARRTDAAQADGNSVQMGKASKQHTEKQGTPEEWKHGKRDGGAVLSEAETKEKPSPRQPKVENSGSGGKAREAVDADFVSACHFVKAHMNNMDNPSEDMRKALVTLFQHWFTTSAEEASEACNVAAYIRAVKKESPSLLSFLVNLPDDNGNTVLHYGVSHCNYSIVSLLLDTGVADVNVQNKAGYTAVMLASLTAPDGPDGMETIRKLMESGNVNIRSSQTGQTALHLAVRHGRDIMVRLLLSCGADTNIQDSQGTTALMFAAEKGHTHVARLLLERSQSDLMLTDKSGRTALSIALQGSHSDTAALLQAHAKARSL